MRARPLLQAIRTVTRRSTTIVTLAALTAVGAGAQNGAPDARPTVAVLYFTNGAIGKNAEYAPLSKGMAEMLITELAANTNIRVVERDRLQALLDEQNLGGSGRVEAGTAARLGKTLGARHMLMGTFVIDPKEMMRVDVRAINTETSELEYATSITGKADKMLAMLAELGTKVNAGLKLPALPASTTPGAATGGGGPNQMRAMMLIGRALEEQDQKRAAAAVTLFKEAVAANPQNPRAKALLASAEKGSK